MICWSSDSFEATIGVIIPYLSLLRREPYWAVGSVVSGRSSDPNETSRTGGVSNLERESTGRPVRRK